MCNECNCKNQRSLRADEKLRTLSIQYNSGSKALAAMKDAVAHMTMEELVALRYRMDPAFSPELAKGIDLMIAALEGQLPD